MRWGHGMQRCQPVPGSNAQDPRAALGLTLRKSCRAKAEPFGFASHPPTLPSHPQRRALPVWQGQVHCFATWTWYFHRDSPPFSNDIPILSPLPGPAHSWETR